MQTNGWRHYATPPIWYLQISTSSKIHVDVVEVSKHEKLIHILLAQWKFSDTCKGIGNCSIQRRKTLALLLHLLTDAEILDGKVHRVLPGPVPKPGL